MRLCSYLVAHTKVSSCSIASIFSTTLKRNSESRWKYQMTPSIQRRKITSTVFTEHSNILSTMLKAHNFASHRDSAGAILVGTHAEQFEEMSDLNA